MGEGRLDRERLQWRLRELEAAHSTSAKAAPGLYLRGLAEGRADAFGNLADWIDSGDFDARENVIPLTPSKDKADG